MTYFTFDNSRTVCSLTGQWTSASCSWDRPSLTPLASLAGHHDTHTLTSSGSVLFVYLSKPHFFAVFSCGRWSPVVGLNPPHINSYKLIVPLWPPAALCWCAPSYAPRTRSPPRCMVSPAISISFNFPHSPGCTLAPEMAKGEELCGCESSHVVATGPSSSTSTTTPHHQGARQMSLSNTFTRINTFPFHPGWHVFV